ncbi:hypothetical protein AADG42_14060 [Ammonicoccus fulvus]|uniref:Major facilitator superfamily (MFS) profile domain-containing protein n=1 Tax=Ammonicoccus fulvus TaxID=3138240 RepID=A0ABZ3FQK3_9ACTN
MKGRVLGTGAAITGLLAVIYGFGVAFGGGLWGPTVATLWLSAGAAIVGVLFVLFILIPWIRSLGAGPKP